MDKIFFWLDIVSCHGSLVPLKEKLIHEEDLSPVILHLIRYRCAMEDAHYR